MKDKLFRWDSTIVVQAKTKEEAANRLKVRYNANLLNGIPLNEIREVSTNDGD